MNAAFCSWLQRDNDIQACGLNDIFAFGKNDIALRATIFTLRVNSRIRNCGLIRRGQVD